MNSKVLTTRQVAWEALIPQLAIMGLLAIVFYACNFKHPLSLASLCYLISSIVLKIIIPASHRRGMKLLKQGNFGNAIPFFEKSIDFFTKYKWIDKYRYITLLSPSKMCYKEMALCNIAFCCSQTDEGIKAKQYYELVLQEFPKNVMASVALKFIVAIEKSQTK